MSSKRKDDEDRDGDEGLLFRLTVAGALALAALVAAGAWLTHHPELRPGPCIKYCR